MTVFVDTSALVALLDASEDRHQAAADAWKTLLHEDSALVTSQATHVNRGSRSAGSVREPTATAWPISVP